MFYQETKSSARRKVERCRPKGDEKMTKDAEHCRREPAGKSLRPQHQSASNHTGHVCSPLLLASSPRHQFVQGFCGDDLLAGATLYVLLGSKMLRTFGVGVIGVVSVLVLMPIILNPLGRGFPRNCKTFGDLVKLALARNYGKMAATHGMTSEKKVVQSLLLLVAAETATDIEKLSPDTLFPEGLKIY
jgi:hypothetical protein